MVQQFRQPTASSKQKETFIVIATEKNEGNNNLMCTNVCRFALLYIDMYTFRVGGTSSSLHIVPDLTMTTSVADAIQPSRYETNISYRDQWLRLGKGEGSNNVVVSPTAPSSWRSKTSTRAANPLEAVAHHSC